MFEKMKVGSLQMRGDLRDNLKSFHYAHYWCYMYKVQHLGTLLHQSPKNVLFKAQTTEEACVITEDIQKDDL